MLETVTLARKALDKRLVAWRNLPPAPHRGWVRALREALGMSSADLASRLGVSRQAILQMERSEADGSIRLETLRRAAEAMDCRLVYALVPNEPLEETIDRRARMLAVEELSHARNTMALEDQAVETGDDEWLVDELADELKKSRRLWRS
jgi:predicted DNA-binding mobile mystery protein A